MLTTFGRWNATAVASGVELTSVEAPAAGLIRIQERKRPWRSVTQMVDDELARFPAELSGPVRDAVDSFITQEGEYAAIASFVARNAKAELRLGVVGATYGDDWYLLVDARCIEEAYFDQFRSIVRELVYHTPLGLGSARRRRFYYQPPEGWEGVARGLLTEWYPPGYPFVDAVITVPPAWPGRELTPPFLERVVIDGDMRTFFKDDQGAPSSFTSDFGLSATLAHIRGQHAGKPRRVIEQVFFRDDRFTQYVRLSCREDLYEDMKDVFLKVAKSCRPLPTEQHDSQGDALVHWVE